MKAQMTAAKSVIQNHADYSYQGRLKEETIKHLENSGTAVLAACPGAGKTEVSISILEALYGSIWKKALVLAHGTNVLLAQYHKDVAAKPRKFTYSSLGPGGKNNISAALHVAIPHYFKNKAVPTYDLIVVDEAHHFVKGGMFKRILKANKNAKVLYLTGTPSPFIWNNKQTENKTPIVSETISTLLDHNVLSNPYIELVQTDLGSVNVSSYNNEENVKDEVELSKGDLEPVFEQVMDALIKRISSRLRHSEKYTSELWKKYEKHQVKYHGDLPMGKTLHLARNKKDARIAMAWYQKAGIPALLSVSGNGKDADKDSLAIEEFRTSEHKVLVVVNRATLGFSMKELENIVDMSFTHNPDRMLQALCRVNRLFPDGKSGEKLYLKVTTCELAPLTYMAMSFTVALSVPDFYNTYDGNWRGMFTPILVEAKKAIDEAAEEAAEEARANETPGSNENNEGKPEDKGDHENSQGTTDTTDTEKGANKPGSKSDSDRKDDEERRPRKIRINLPRLCTFIDLKHLDRDTSAFAYTTFQAVKSKLYSDRNSWAEALEAYFA